jgi:hypothetical protein
MVVQKQQSGKVHLTALLCYKLKQLCGDFRKAFEPLDCSI